MNKQNKRPSIPHYENRDRDLKNLIKGIIDHAAKLDSGCPIIVFGHARTSDQTMTPSKRVSRFLTRGV